MPSYVGEDAYDAGRVLDDSQGEYGDGAPARAHPRGHASHPSAQGEIDSIENYSRTGKKSGFLSREDQNKAAHYVLQSSQASNAMENLNRGGSHEYFKADIRNLKLRMAWWKRGRMLPKSQALAALASMVLQHRKGHRNRSESNPHVLTLFPREGESKANMSRGHGSGESKRRRSTVARQRSSSPKGRKPILRKRSSSSVQKRCTCFRRT